MLLQLQDCAAPESVMCCGIYDRQHQEQLISMMLNHELHTSHLSLAALE